MRSSLPAVCLSLWARAAYCAECAVQQDLAGVSDAMMACEGRIGEAGAQLEDPDPAERSKAAQIIADAARVLTRQEDLLGKLAGNADSAGTVNDNIAQIADIRDIHKDEISKAETVSRRPVLPPDGKGPPPAGPGGAGPGKDAKTAAGGAPPSGGAGSGAAGHAGAGASAGGAPGGRSGEGEASPRAGQSAFSGSKAAESAVSRAKAAASGFNSAEDDGLSGSAKGGSLKGTGLPARSPGAPAGGKETPPGSDLAALAASGFAASFQQSGLTLGPGGRILRPDGSEASESDIGRLRAQIAKDPQALLRRPDFFDVIGRPDFEQLKNDFHAKPEEKDKAFRHVALEDERDFSHSESCNPELDRDCNRQIKKPYRKGRFVSPEDLKAIDEALRPSGSMVYAAPTPQAGSGASSGAGDAVAGTGPRGFRLARFADRLKAILGRSKARPGAPSEAAPACAPADGVLGTAAVSSAPHRYFHAWQMVVLAALAAAWSWLRRPKKGFLERQ